MHRTRLAFAALAAFAVLAARPRLAAATETSVYALLSRDVWVVPEAGTHGAVFVEIDIEGLPAGSRAHASLNIETLRLAWESIDLGNHLEAGMHLKGEALFAGVLSDYVERGRRIDAEGFAASYLEAEATLKALLPAHHSLEVVARGRRWFFTRGTDLPVGPDTDPGLVLPAEAWVFEPRLRHTYWNLADDPSWREPHRLFPRVRGLAAGIEVGLDLRSEVRAWGLADGGGPDVARNDPRPVLFGVGQWGRAGWQAHPRVRLQLAEWVAWQAGGDDLSRTRVGGMSPYAIPLPGASWVAFRSDVVVAGEASLHVHVAGEAEVGVAGNLVWLTDPNRTGEADDDALHAGVALFADVRAGRFQIDLRLGWSPTLRWESRSGSWALFAGIGWGGAS